jgi:hypothetical protein
LGSSVISAALLARTVKYGVTSYFTDAFFLSPPGVGRLGIKKLFRAGIVLGSMDGPDIFGQVHVIYLKGFGPVIETHRA